MDYDTETKTFTRPSGSGFSVRLDDGMIDIVQDDGSAPNSVLLMPDEAVDLVEALKHLLEEHKKAETVEE